MVQSKKQKKRKLIQQWLVDIILHRKIAHTFPEEPDGVVTVTTGSMINTSNIDVPWGKASDLFALTLFTEAMGLSWSPQKLLEERTITNARSQCITAKRTGR